MLFLQTAARPYIAMTTQMLKTIGTGRSIWPRYPRMNTNIRPIAVYAFR